MERAGSGKAHRCPRVVRACIHAIVKNAQTEMKKTMRSTRRVSDQINQESRSADSARYRTVISPTHFKDGSVPDADTSLRAEHRLTQTGWVNGTCFLTLCSLRGPSCSHDHSPRPRYDTTEPTAHIPMTPDVSCGSTGGGSLHDVDVIRSVSKL